MKSQLLALPREIRNKIYSRLAHDVTFRDEYQLSCNHMFIKIKNAPLPQLLLVNRQLHNEYKEHSNNLSAQIAIDALGMVLLVRF
jgi:hypothetical protein